MKALHDLTVLHRDLKCANIFLGSKGEVKLGEMDVNQKNYERHASGSVATTKKRKRRRGGGRMSRDLKAAEYGKSHNLHTVAGCRIADDIVGRDPLLQGVSFEPNVPVRASQPLVALGVGGGRGSAVDIGGVRVV